MLRTALLILSLAAVFGLCPERALAQQASSPACCIELHNGSLSMEVDPATLAVRVNSTVISGPVARMAYTIAQHNGDTVELRYPKKDATVRLELTADHLDLTVSAAQPTTFAWPKLRMGDTEALIWPRDEGSYIPLGDSAWTQFLTSQSWDTLEGLEMPFWGVEEGGKMLTYIVSNPFHNEINFTKGASALTLDFQHVFPPNKALHNPITFEVYVAKEISPIQPAVLFRKYLESHGGIVTLKEKEKTAPLIARLIGAPHAYLWGGAPLTTDDVKGGKRAFTQWAQQLVKEAQQKQETVGKHIKALLSPDQWNQIVQLANAKYSYPYIMQQFVDALSSALLSPRFDDAVLWSKASLPADIVALTQSKSLTGAQQLKLNSYLLYQAYSAYLIKPNLWGGGVSLQMLDALKSSGINRMMLCLDGWEQIDRRPYIAEAASKMGFLFGVYDSYNTILTPKYKGTDQSYPTAQFGEKLYQTGAIENQDGQKLTGFKQRGYLLSPIAAWPYVQARVKANMSKVPYSYYFVDADAFGEYYDDYTPGRMATQKEDAQARIDRLKWITDTFHVPVGSEGGNYLFAKVLAVAEGVIEPPLPTWSDSDLTDKSSKYYLGRYYPPDGPDKFMKPVPMKEKYIHLDIDPRFRLPLYETVFHDSVITANHWESGSLKFSNVDKTVALTQMFYQVPPLYNLNLDRFAQVEDRIKAFYTIFSQSAQTTAFLPVTDFAWLTSGRKVQRIDFGSEVEAVANYTAKPFVYEKTTIPALSVLLINHTNQEKRIYTP